MTATTITNRIGRLAAVTLAAGIGVVGLTGSPASADRPIEFSDSSTFADVNPCTDELVDITINVDVRLHEHKNGNVVVHVSRTGTTSDGYVMDHGQENFVSNGNVVRSTLNDVWRNGDGSAFQAQSVFVAKEDGVVVGGFRLRCVKP